jgi:hypothetical protein
MITIKRCLSLLCIGVIFFSSCEKSTEPPHLQAIPADASFVGAIESKQLIKKGGLDNLKEFKFFQMINREISRQNSDMQEFVNKLVENPDASGIDWDRFYVYGCRQSSGFYVAATFLIDNLSAFEDNMGYLTQQAGNAWIEDKGDYKIITPDNSLVLAWNKQVFLVFGGDLGELDYGKFFSRSGGESIVGVTDFREFQKENYDAGFWISNDALMDLLEDEMNISKPSYMNEFSSMYIHSYLHCNDGEIKITGKVTPQSKLDEFYAKYPIIKKNFNNRLLEDFPETTYWATKLAVNLPAYLKLMNEAAASTGVYDLQEMLDSPAAKTVIDGLDGDFLLSLYGFAQGPFPMPLVGISFSVKSEEDFNRILSLVPQEIVQRTGKFYSIGSMGFAVYVAYKDKRVLLTDDADAITAFVENGYSKSLKNSSLASNLKNEPSLFYLNLDLNSYPGNIRALLQNEMPRDVKPAITFLEICKDFSFGSDKDNQFYVSLKFKDNKQNGLKLLIKSLDDIAAQ